MYEKRVLGDPVSRRKKLKLKIGSPSGEVQVWPGASLRLRRAKPWIGGEDESAGDELGKKQN